ncbi:MAG: M23 family peptidase [Bacteroidetes bacterium]|nr:MAG: M23 family peptidase [Bacteroidota bacterium]
MKVNLEKQSWFNRLFTNLNYKYKLVIMNESTFDEKLSFRISRMLVFIVYGVVTVFSIATTILIIYLTPLKEFIPGYASVDRVKQVHINRMKIDSLEHEIRQRDLYLDNFRSRILLGQDLDENDSLVLQKNESIDYENLVVIPSHEDSLLREEWENIPDYDLSYNNLSQGHSKISQFFFMAPIHGIISAGFNQKQKHFGVDILGKKGDPVKACLDGMVFFSTWTYDFGYVIAVQHSDDIISIYKHNSTLLKKDGDLVSAGDPIAIIGNTGEKSTGPHLHFEIWYKLNPVNPTQFISFD